MQYQDMTKKEMQREYHRLYQRYQEYEQQGLQLDLSRGKPAPEQLALSQRMLGELNSRSVLDSEDGTDCRNSGGGKWNNILLFRCWLRRSLTGGGFPRLFPRKLHHLLALDSLKKLRSCLKPILRLHR